MKKEDIMKHIDRTMLKPIARTHRKTVSGGNSV